jgi:hypothetical protein
MCILSLFGFALPCNYISHHRQVLLEHGYLVMDYVEGGGIKMLSETCDEFWDCQNWKKNLFQDLT